MLVKESVITCHSEHPRRNHSSVFAISGIVTKEKENIIRSI